MAAIQNRYDFVYLFDVTNGNPNGDPDAGNLPRLDPESNLGLVSDVCLKRKVRNFVTMTQGESPGYDIYVAERAILNNQQKRAWKVVMPEVTETSEMKKLPKDQEKARRLTAWMCSNFFDIRTFGAVMTTGVNCGQVRGPVQFTFARSVEPILPLEVAITRMAVTKEADADAKGDNRTIGRKHLVPYGLYRAHGYVSACLAGDGTKGTGFSDDDLEILWTALEQMFDHDRSAARGEMAARRLVVFEHRSKFGNVPAHKLLERVSIARKYGGEQLDLDVAHAKSLPPARSYADYAVRIERSGMPQGVEIVDRI